jgi:hypothetical protein
MRKRILVSKMIRYERKQILVFSAIGYDGNQNWLLIITRQVVWDTIRGKRISVSRVIRYDRKRILVSKMKLVSNHYPARTVC